MLQILSSRRFRDCEGISRRNLLRAGALGLGGLTLPQLLQARAWAAEQGRPVSQTSVVWLWLGGGATHIETFNPNMDAPSDYRSTTGEVATCLPGVSFGGGFEKMARVADKMAVVRSFSHRNSGHAGGTHWLMTGYDNRQVDNGGAQTRPSIGSIVSRVRGANHAESGIPTYVAMDSIRSGEGSAFLGSAYSPFKPNGQARKDMTLTVSEQRLSDRRYLLGKLDAMKRDADAGGQLEGMSRFEEQAFNVMLGGSARAFDNKDEDTKTVERYTAGNRNWRLGQQLLTARRLCEAGTGFVTVSYGGWDMHQNIRQSMEKRVPELDHAVAAFIEDVYQRGLQDRILLVISGEFGRTPKVNATGGRDHWAPLSTLALAGGGLKMGQVVGESASRGDVPHSTPVTPQDLMATIMHVMGIPREIQFTDTFGRPTYMLENGRVIPELV